MFGQLKRRAAGLLTRMDQRLADRIDLAARTSAQSKIAQLQLWMRYRGMAAAGNVPPLSQTGFRCFSQFEEDGLLLFIFALLDINQGVFLDIGSGDGINSNCANLALNFGWRGTFIDGDQDNIAKGRAFYAGAPIAWAYPPQFLQRTIGAENIDDIVAASDTPPEIDLLSIDIDGNDYWVWKALVATNPKVVIVETHVEFGLRDIVVPYNKDYAYPGRHPDYHGASPVAMANLANAKGYRLVGANAYGFNTIYVRRGLAEHLLPEVSVQSILAHPRNAERAKLFEPIKDWAYVRGAA